MFDGNHAEWVVFVKISNNTFGFIYKYVARFPYKGDVSQWLYKHWDPGEVKNCENSKISEFQSSRRPNEKSWKNLIPLAPFMYFEESVVSLSCLFAFKIMHVLQMMISFLAKATKEDQQFMLPTSETSRFVADCNSFCRLC